MTYAEPYEKKMWWRSVGLFLTYAFFVFSPLSDPLWRAAARALPETMALPNLCFALSVMTDALIIGVAILLFGRELLAAAKGIHHEEKAMRRKKFALMFPYYFVTIVFRFVFAVMIARLDLPEYNQQALEEMANDAATLLFIIEVVIIGPVVEEIIFRFGIYRFVGLWSKTAAHALSALLFGFGHIVLYVTVENFWGQILVMLPYCAMGLAISLYYEKTGNLCYPIALHMLNNGIAAAFIYMRP